LYCLLELLYGSSELNEELFPTHCRKRDLPVSKMTPTKIRKIRKLMGMSQQDFSRFLWVTYSTLSRWELGYATPFGLHLSILTQLENQLTRPTLRSALRDPKSEDFTFLLYRLLKLSYWRRK
jgi:DNA-binding transcriptional regulator YiaG